MRYYEAMRWDKETRTFSEPTAIGAHLSFADAMDAGARKLGRGFAGLLVQPVGAPKPQETEIEHLMRNANQAKNIGREGGAKLGVALKRARSQAPKGEK